MSRIRSVHPGQWTDEDFVTCSPLARLLAIGLRNEADDHGVFEWKPVSLKMKLLPMDICDVPKLLLELETTRQVRRYEIDGRQFGVIRNFMAYQRPKKPLFRHPLPPDWDEQEGKQGQRKPPGGSDEGGTGGEPDDADSRGSTEPSPNERGLVSPQRDTEADSSDASSPESGTSPAEEGGRRERREEDNTASGGGRYVFEGAVIRLNRRNFDEWRRAYHAIPDLTAALQKLDDFYAETLALKQRGNWFIRASAALSNQHQDALVRAAVAGERKAARAGGYIPLGVGG